MSQPDDPAASRVLDVRDTEGEPFDRITAALGDLAANEELVLVNSFEPEPLYSVLEQRGFQYRTERTDPSTWRVYISRDR